MSNPKTIDAIAHLVDDLKTRGEFAQAIERIYGLKRVAVSEGWND